jgi:hypothetical protein
MKREEAFPSKYLSKEDVPQAVSVSIARISKTEIGDEENPKLKTIIEFNGFEKPMILNATNWDTLEAAYGEESDGWIGKACEVFTDPNVMYAGKKTGGLRIRVRADWTFPEAVKAAAEVNVTEDQIKAAVKAAGGKGWSPERDTPLVKRMIDEASVPF